MSAMSSGYVDSVILQHIRHLPLQYICGCCVSLLDFGNLS
jgi:hypothetical protein